MDTISIQAGPFSFVAKLEVEPAPKTCDVFRRLLPFGKQVLWRGAQRIAFESAG